MLVGAELASTAVTSKTKVVGNIKLAITPIAEAKTVLIR